MATMKITAFLLNCFEFIYSLLKIHLENLNKQQELQDFLTCKPYMTYMTTIMNCITVDRLLYELTHWLTVITVSRDVLVSRNIQYIHLEVKWVAWWCKESIKADGLLRMLPYKRRHFLIQAISFSIQSFWCITSFNGQPKWLKKILLLSGLPVVSNHYVCLVALLQHWTFLSQNNKMAVSGKCLFVVK